MQKTKYGLSFVVAASSVLLLVACGDDNSTKANDKIVVDSVDDLSNCVATKVGNLEYVDTVAYVCVELGDKIKWVQVAGVEDNSEDFRACTGKKDGLYSFSPKENTLYVCNDEEWVPVKQLDDNDSMEESGSSETKSSSSSVTPKSSSSETSVSSSSSLVGRSLCNVNTDEDCFKDERDGQTYRTVKIGSQTWMAENLNYETTNSYCYNDAASNCTKYGRLYTWNAAKTDCPSGWHLPTETEWNTLFTAVGGQSTAGKMLKSTSGWNGSGNWTDAYAFSALPAGIRGDDGHFDHEGYYAYFWSSTEDASYLAYYMYLNYNNVDARLDVSNKRIGFSVRCLKDDSPSSVTPQSSSSSTSVSSSSKVPELAEGTLTDTRDGTTYKTVTIGTQTWMAENLNYKTVDSYCYKGAASNCTKYGRLYTWAAAMDSMGTWSANGKGCGYNKTCSPTYPVRGVCPEGWHLPTKAEFETLFTAVGGFSTAGKMLKSSSGWNSSGNGTDAYAFSALPAGIRVYDGNFNYEGYYAYFWSSTELNSIDAYSMYLDCYNGIADLNLNYKHSGFSVRCVKD